MGRRSGPSGPPYPALTSNFSFSSSQSFGLFIIVTLLGTHGHPSLHPLLHSWSPFSALIVTLLCIHSHPFLHTWSPFSVLMVTLRCTHGHPSQHSWSPFSALMVTVLCTHGHPSLHSWSPFSALMVTLLCTLGHPSLLSSPRVTLLSSLHTWSPISLLCTHGHPLYSWSLSLLSPPSLPLSTLRLSTLSTYLSL